MRLRRYRLVMSAVLMLGAGTLALSTPAHAATDRFRYNQRPPVPKPVKDPNAANGQMLVKALEINYDYNNNRVAAVGNVQIYYNGSTLEADKVIYDQKSKRLHAEGNVRLTEPDGKVVNANLLDLSDDYRDGFVDSLHLNTPDETRMSAARADRTNGDITIFQSGTYTACAECRDHPERPPLWQVKAARIIHNKTEQMLYFEDAKVEFFGHPLAYLPYFSTPDPTVKRKTGLLMPSISSNSKYGVAYEQPYYMALAPDYDATIAPMITTKQGVLLQGEFRQRLLNGAYQIRGAGIRQLDKDYFIHDNGSPTPGYRDWRGSLESSGQFALNQQWVWGWDALLLSDKTFLQDYNPRLSQYHVVDAFSNGASQGVSQAYLVGKGNRSYFDARSIYFQGFSEADNQGEIPVIHPVIDYMYTVDHPVLGGELSYNFNFTSLSRESADFDPITPRADSSGACAQTADPAIKIPASCLLRGVPGTFTRFSAEAQWRRTITDSLGQVFTPFASVRADLGTAYIQSEPGVANYIEPGNHDLTRAMPTVGVEYRYPFIDIQSWGTQTITPIAQVIARPDEPQIGRWPNEDAQSLIFDDSNLFKIDKFSGWDRVEGGGRANYGVEYTMQFNQGGFVNALFGQSYQLFGENSFAQGGTTNTGLGSGLDTRLSDYVARVSYQPNRTYTFTSRFRFDKDDFTVRRTELESRADFDRWSLSVLYGDYAAEPKLGFLEDRQGILGTVSYKLSTNWVVLGAARYDLDAEKFDQTRIGLGYVDDCLILAVNYVTSYTYSGNPEADHAVMLQLSLRTLGGTSVTQNVGGLGGL
jgi:LPS-assembly protein